MGFVPKLEAMSESHDVDAGIQGGDVDAQRLGQSVQTKRTIRPFDATSVHTIRTEC